jgi:dTDP-4-dehydrorhamnose reductase
MKSIAIIGINGYVGAALERQCALQGIPCMEIGRDSVGDVRTLTQAILQSGASFLINCAGYTGKPNVDACELHKTECLYGNAVLPGIVRQACEMADIPWGHVSSGCIFSGKRSDGSGFREEDPPNFSFRQNNCSFYSGCKALGEEVLEGAQKCYIWRLRIPFENTANPRNYLQKLMSYQRLLDAENSLSQLDEFVAACLDSFRLQIPFGTYNLTNPGSVWTHEVVEFIKRTGVCSKAFEFFESEADFMKLAAKTPRSNCVMDSSKAIAAGLKLTPVREALERSLRNWGS